MSFAFVLRVAVDNRLTLFRRVVLGVVDLHACDVLGHDPPFTSDNYAYRQ
jgi:hypothetical protein